MLNETTQIETPRLLLAPLTLKDAPDLQRITNTAKIIESISFLQSDFTVEDARNLISQNGEDVCFLGVWEREEACLVGLFGVHKQDGDEVEIGYWFSQDHQGRGFASETLEHATLYLEQKHPKLQIIAECADENQVSQHVLRKNGFKSTGEDGKRPGRKRYIWRNWRTREDSNL